MNLTAKLESCLCKYDEQKYHSDYKWPNLIIRSTRSFKLIFQPNLLCITSGPEVQQIFKIRTVWQPDVSLSGLRTFNTKQTLEKKNQKIFSKNFFKFSLRFFFVYLFDLRTFDT